MDALERIRESAVALARRVSAGAPLGDWTEAEVVLAMLLVFFADPSKLSGTRRTKSGDERQHPVVQAIARTIGRTDGAVVLKVMNLRKELTGGARGMGHRSKIDAWAAKTFGGHLDDLMAAAMLVADHVSGVDELLDAVGPAREPTTTRPVVPPTVPPTTTARREVAVRRGQDLFRSRVMSNYVHACAFCGLRARRPASNTYFLIAGHILPWKDASDHQRLDPRNGLALCAIHDRAFEWGFVGLDAQLQVVVSPAVNDHYEPPERVRAEFGWLHGRELRREAPGFEEPAAAYLEHHRERVFEKRFREVGAAG